jgi:hypothetical protein
VTIDGAAALHAPKGRGPDLARFLTHGWPWTFWDWKEVCRLADPLRYGSAGMPSTWWCACRLRVLLAAHDHRRGPQRIATLWLRLMRDVLATRASARPAATGAPW